MISKISVRESTKSRLVSGVAKTAMLIDKKCQISEMCITVYSLTFRESLVMLFSYVP